MAMGGLTKEVAVFMNATAGQKTDRPCGRMYPLLFVEQLPEHKGQHGQTDEQLQGDGGQEEQQQKPGKGAGHASDQKRRNVARVKILPVGPGHISGQKGDDDAGTRDKLGQRNEHRHQGQSHHGRPHSGEAVDKPGQQPGSEKKRHADSGHGSGSPG